MESSLELRVRFAETDQMGIVHHSAWVVWLEAARIEWLRERGLSYRELEDSGVSLAVSELHLRYRAAARFDDLLSVVARLEDSRSRRIVFSYRVLRAGSGELLAEAQTRHVPTDRSGRAIRLSGSWLESLNRATVRHDTDPG